MLFKGFQDCCHSGHKLDLILYPTKKKKRIQYIFPCIQFSNVIIKIVTTCRFITKLQYDINEYPNLYICILRGKVWQFKPVCIFCTRSINPNVHIAFRLFEYSLSGYCFYIFFLTSVSVPNGAMPKLYYACPKDLLKHQNIAKLSRPARIPDSVPI